MPVRSEEEDVIAVMTNDYDENVALAPFIVAASNIIDNACAVYTEDYSDADLELIERWLSAHFYCQNLAPRTAEGVGGVSEQFQRATALGFDNTHYGQMAMRLDRMGGLAELNERMKTGGGGVGITWLGEDLTDCTE